MNIGFCWLSLLPHRINLASLSIVLDSFQLWKCMPSLGIDISNGYKCLRTNWLQINCQSEARKQWWNSNHGETVITARSLASLFVMDDFKAVCLHSIQTGDKLIFKEACLHSIQTDDKLVCWESIQIDDNLIQRTLLAFYSDRQRMA